MVHLPARLQNFTLLLRLYSLSVQLSNADIFLSSFVDELDSADDGPSAFDSAAPLLCISESLMGGMGPDERVTIGLVAVIPSTSEVIYDQFIDTAMRPELEVSLLKRQCMVCS